MAPVVDLKKAVIWLVDTLIGIIDNSALYQSAPVKLAPRKKLS